MPPKAASLGSEIIKSLEALQDLIAATKDAAQKEALRDQRKALLKTIGDLVETSLNSASQEYRDATDAVKESSKAIRKALNDLSQIAKAIQLIAQAISMVVKLVP